MSRSESFWASADGGRTWARVAARGLPGNGAVLQNGRDQAVSDPFALDAVSRRAAWLAQTHGSPALFRTVDGGRSWSRVSVSDASGGTLLGAPSFWGDHGVLAIAQPGGRLVVDVSDDAGGSWHVASTLATGSLTPISGFDAISSTDWVAPAPAGLFETTDSGRHWSRATAGISLGQTNLGGDAQFSFASPESGLVIPAQLTGSGALFTENAGRSWSRSFFPAIPGGTTSAPSVALSPEATDLVAAGSLIYRRTASGRWKPVLRALSPLSALSFANARDGWALTPMQLFMSTDRGAKWSVRTEPAAGALVQAQLITDNRGVGVACGADDGLAEQTSNAGRSWQPMRTQPPHLICGGPGANALCFASANQGWALVRTGGRDTLALLHTADGGRRWTRSLLVTRAGAGGAIGCHDSSLWVSAAGYPSGMWGFPGAVFVSEDDGRHWLDTIATGPQPPTAVGVPTTRNQSDEQILDLTTAGPQTLLLLTGCIPCATPGHDGRLELEVSTDGGRQWRKPDGDTPLPYLGDGEGLGEITFTSPNRGELLAQSGTSLRRLVLIKTNDQGRSWKLIATFTP